VWIVVAAIAKEFLWIHTPWCSHHRSSWHRLASHAVAGHARRRTALTGTGGVSRSRKPTCAIAGQLMVAFAPETFEVTDVDPYSDATSNAGLAAPVGACAI